MRSIIARKKLEKQICGMEQIGPLPPFLLVVVIAQAEAGTAHGLHLAVPTEWNGSNTRASSVSGMPGPFSSMITNASPPSTYRFAVAP
jgi:hypothetical protein